MRVHVSPGGSALSSAPVCFGSGAPLASLVTPSPFFQSRTRSCMLGGRRRRRRGHRRLLGKLQQRRRARSARWLQRAAAAGSAAAVLS